MSNASRIRSPLEVELASLMRGFQLKLNPKMTFDPNFVRMRLRNLSLPEFFCRLRQVIASLRLKWSIKMGFKFFEPPKIENEEIEKLIQPEMMPDSEGKTSHGLSCADSNYIPNPEPLDLVAAQTDIRMRWEPARLQQAVAWLVLARQGQGDVDWEKTRQRAKEMVLSWIQANPFFRGEHYQSAMEGALRLPVFFMVVKEIDDLSPAETAMVLDALYHHACWISKRMSLYSSLGNHTIAEAVGLIFAGAVYRSTRRGREWLGTGIRLLDEELNHQILDDGGPAEQSLGYHRFVLDLYWLAYDLIRKNNLGSVVQWQTRLTLGESFLQAFQDQKRLFPAIGDSDDGFAVAPGIAPARGPVDAGSENHITFAESGYSVIRNERLVFIFDHGPLGMAPFYNHGHADALSITLTKNGCPLLVDPGTYRYNGVPQWRRYFKGTRAHNTVTIDDQDQAVQETSFIWSKPYDGQLTAFESVNGELFYNATHNGYLRLPSPVTHYRSVFFFDQENFLIRDRFIGAGSHCFQINFHFHPDAVVDVDGPWWVVEHGAERVFLRLLEGAFETVRGRINPPLGWFSSRYGQKEPTSTLTCTRTGASQDVVLTTVICTRRVLGDDRINIKAGEFASKINNS